MCAKMTAADERYRLVTECRASGLADYQWCLEHALHRGFFTVGETEMVNQYNKKYGADS